MSIKVGLIGLGNILPSHLAALKTAPEFTLASVCDAVPDKARRWAMNSDAARSPIGAKRSRSRLTSP